MLLTKFKLIEVAVNLLLGDTFDYCDTTQIRVATKATFVTTQVTGLNTLVGRRTNEPTRSP